MKKLEFRRNFSARQVMNVILQEYPRFKLRHPKFMKCSSGSEMDVVRIDGNYPDGEQLIQIASKESVYVVEVSFSLSLHDVNLKPFQLL